MLLVPTLCQTLLYFYGTATFPGVGALHGSIVESLGSSGDEFAERTIGPDGIPDGVVPEERGGEDSVLADAADILTNDERRGSTNDEPAVFARRGSTNDEPAVFARRGSTNDEPAVFARGSTLLRTEKEGREGTIRVGLGRTRSPCC